MCEHCTAPASGWSNYRHAIRSCPRLGALGEGTIEWLDQAIDYEVQDAQADLQPSASTASRRSDTSHGGWLQVVNPVSRRRLLLPLSVVVGIEILGMARADVIWGWWQASPNQIMLTGSVLLQLLIVALLIAGPPRQRH